MSFQAILLITLPASVMEIPLICYFQPRSLNLVRPAVFLKKLFRNKSSPVFIKIALIFYFIASSSGLVVSIHMTLFITFMITA